MKHHHTPTRLDIKLYETGYTKSIVCCSECDELLVWGKANDSKPEIRIEIRAAEIIGSSNASGMTDVEWDWYLHGEWPPHTATIRDPFTFEEWAGYLAHCIDDDREDEVEEAVDEAFDDVDDAPVRHGSPPGAVRALCTEATPADHVVKTVYAGVFEGGFGPSTNDRDN